MPNFVIPLYQSVDERTFVNVMVLLKLFISSLEKIGVTHALYLDMGSGWNHSWYRDNEERVVEIHPKTHSYTTNWLVFKR